MLVICINSSSPFSPNNNKIRAHTHKKLVFLSSLVRANRTKMNSIADKSNAEKRESNEQPSFSAFLPSHSMLREQLSGAETLNEKLEKELRQFKDDAKREEERRRENEREFKFARQLNAKLTNDLIESEAGRMRLRAEVDQLLSSARRKEKLIQVLKEEVERKAQKESENMHQQMEREKEKLQGMMEGDALVNSLIAKMFGTSVSNDEEDVEEGAVMTAEPGENDQRLLRNASERMQFATERAKQNKLVNDIESQLIATKKRLIQCETFQSESESQLVKDKSELQSAVARLQSLVESLSNVEKTKDEEIARLRQKRRALEKELDDLSAELESVKASSSFRKAS
jgi:hypothetical protein